MKVCHGALIKANVLILSAPTPQIPRSLEIHVVLLLIIELVTFPCFAYVSC